MTSISARRFSSLAVSALSVASMLIGSVVAATPASAAPKENPSAVGQEKKAERLAVNTDRFIVKFSGTAKELPSERGNAYGKVAKETGVTVKEVKSTVGDAYVVSADHRLSDAEASKLLTSLKKQPNVEYVEADILMQATATPNDPNYSLQWYLTDQTAGLQMPTVWDRTTGAGQIVAVLDTGITSHSDLNANVIPGYDMISDPANAKDGDGRDANASDVGDYRVSGDCGSTGSSGSSWHGTHVAGTIAAVTNNASGVAGVAYGAKVQPVRVLGSCGGYMSDIADAIVWASGGTVSGIPVNSTPAKTLNLSLGGNSTCSTTSQIAIDSAVQRGSSVFVAAGNSNQPAANSTPANCNNVITIAASSREGNKASYSNYGAAVDLTAPGGDSSGSIASTYNSGTTTPGAESYAYMSGTSMATPQAAAIGALMKAADASLTPALIEQKLKTTARPLAGVCAEGCGAGLVNPQSAVVVNTAPAPTSSVTSSTPTITGTAKVGYTLTANAGTWGPSPVTLAYQWNRAGAAIAGATGSTYALTAADQGKAITVTVTGSKTGYNSVAKTSAATAAVAAGTLTYSTPTITGTLNVGSTLTANPGAWGPAPVTLSYQWYRSGVAVTGATATTYALTSTDAGKQMSVRVTGTKAGYQGFYATSASTAAIGGATLAYSTPTITGTVKYGYTLTANPGAWTEGTSFTYQWYRSGRAISGATASTYKLNSLDRFDTMSVRVIGSKAGYSSVTTYSASTTKVP